MARQADQSYDAVIVGASIAGTTTAMLLAREGARVALVERSADPASFKRVCGHFIQASGVPTLRRLGLLEDIEALGGVHCRSRLKTPWGTIEPSEREGSEVCLNIRREVLDPLLRRHAAETPGVDLLAGAAVDGLLRDGATIAGVEARRTDGERLTLRAPLVVGADGRASRVADLAGLERRTSPHGRFAYGAYYETGAATQTDGTLWLTDPGWAAEFPTDSGLTLYGVMPTKDRLPEFKADLVGAFERYLAEVPDGPEIEPGRRVGEVFGKLDLTNVRRGPVAPGLALVGDAAIAADPLWGVGCGWALQSGEWLAESVAPALIGEGSLERGLARYRRKLRRQIGMHAAMIDSYATGRRFSPGERMLFSAAPHDARLAETMERFGTRSISPVTMFARGVPRAMWVHATRQAGRRERRSRSIPASTSPISRS